MKKAIFKNIAFAVALSWSLTGCIAYQYDGKRYESKEGMYQAQAAAHAETMAMINPLPAPVTNKKLIFAIPSEFTIAEESIRRNRTLNPGPMNSATDDVIRTLSNVNFLGVQSLYDVIKKKNVYPQVDLVYLDTMNGSIAPSDQADAMFYVEPTMGAGQWFYSTVKGGKQAFAFDRSPPTQALRAQNFLAAVQSQAVRE